MTYTITSKRQAEDTLFTTVEYVFEEFSPSVSVTVEVAHFQPQSVNDITIGIENRAESERRKVEAARLIENELINQI